MSLYGHDRPTTPFLDEWARGARVYEDALSTASYTIPAHASMFTGLLPSEHCANNGAQRLGNRYVTIAELLRQAGWRTFLYSANPHISATGNFNQGFEQTLHPWSPEYQARALRLVRNKVEGDRSSELGERLSRPSASQLIAWNVKAAGEVAAEATTAWLQANDDGRPWFAFLNYMEAHRPLIPPRHFRGMVMDPARIEASYQVDRSWDATWAYTFGLGEYSDEELELTGLTYDAALRELDELLRTLFEKLDAMGVLENTIVILTSDHGEHLGEHHMLDHQYTNYQPALRVPLVVHYPPRVAAGRERRPVMNFDLFPTVLELTGVPPPPGLVSRARSLLDPQADRVRFAEEPSFSTVGIDAVLAEHPDFDPSPWQRRLRSLIDGTTKFIWGSDGRHQLFDLAADPGETRNQVEALPDKAREMEQAIGAYHDSLALCESSAPAATPVSPEERRRLESLGYVAN
jgi:arylsulfatase A-like enzyme